MTDEGSIDKLQKTTNQRFGAVNAVVNNAGIVIKGFVHEMKSDDWDSIFNTNVKGTFLVSKAFLPEMMNAHKGTIVNISSVSGLAGDYGMTAYNASKAAIVNMTRAMAMDYGKYGIRVNSVAPGPTDTNMFPQEMKGIFSQNSPLNRIVKPEEIDDKTSHKIAREIKEKIENTMQYPGTIKVTVIRETRVTEEAK